MTTWGWPETVTAIGCAWAFVAFMWAMVWSDRGRGFVRRQPTKLYHRDPVKWTVGPDAKRRKVK